MMDETPNKSMSMETPGLYIKEVQNLAKEKEEAIKDLQSKSAEEIKSQVLSKEEKPNTAKELKEKLAKEERKRLSAYTTITKDGRFKINYEKIGGSDHEAGIGLGDLLVAGARKIEVIKYPGTSRERRITATRTIIEKGAFKGRVGFIDENGDYVTTHSNSGNGDEFRILASTEISDEEFQKNYKREKTAREKLQIRYKQQKTRTYKSQEIASSMLEQETTSPTQTYSHFEKNNEININESNSVVSQISNLKEKQLEMAKIIEEEFTKSLIEFGKNNSKFQLNNLQIKRLVAAAIINAIAESSLNPTIKGDHGRSIGLFQLHDKGAGRGMTIESRQDPRINCRTMLKREVLGRFGLKYLLPAAKRNASVERLTAIFCQRLERPKNPKERGKERARKVAKYFKSGISNSESIATKQETGTSEERIKGKYDVVSSKRKFEAIVDVQGGQDRWVFGSSAVGHTRPYLKNSGIVGISGHNPSNFFSRFKETIWPKIKHLKMPKEIVLVGMAVNGISFMGVKNTERAYMEMVKFFESRGVKVKIATVQPAEGLGEKIHAFNEMLRTKYPQYVLDIAKTFSTADGKHIAPEWAASDGIHLKKQGRRIYADIIEGRA